MESTEWAKIVQETDDIDQRSDVFKSYLGFCSHLHVPTMTIQLKLDKPWMSGKIRRLLKLRRDALGFDDRSRVRQLQHKNNVKSAKLKYTFQNALNPASNQHQQKHGLV